MLESSLQSKFRQPCVQITQYLYVNAGYGLLLAVALAATSVAESVLVNQYFHILFRISLHLKVSRYLSTEILVE